jgi:pyruvate-formate lyase
MAVTRTKAEEFRRLAQECRATAQTLATEQARAEMLAMADVCDHAAAQPRMATNFRKQRARQRATSSSAAHDDTSLGNRE